MTGTCKSHLLWMTCEDSLNNAHLYNLLIMTSVKSTLLTISIHRKIWQAIIKASIWSRVMLGQHKHLTMSENLAYWKRYGTRIPSRFNQWRDRELLRWNNTVNSTISTLYLKENGQLTWNALRRKHKMFWAFDFLSAFFFLCVSVAGFNSTKSPWRYDWDLRSPSFEDYSC